MTSKSLAISIVNRMWATHWIQNARTFESAKLEAIVCQREMLKCFKTGFGIPGSDHTHKDTEEYAILTGLTKEIYSLKYKK